MFYTPVNANEKCYLECDAYSLVTVAADQWWLWFCPIICAGLQLGLLFVLTDQPEFIFINGQWLEPWSHQKSSMNVIKTIAAVVTYLKISTEFTCNELLVTHLRGQHHQTKVHSFFSWLAVILQYVVSYFFMFTALQMILAESVATKTVVKALAVWMVVDLDNYFARYVVEALDVHLSWMHTRSARPTREPYDTLVFHIIPGMFFWTLMAFCMYARILPLSYIYYGRVSNLNAPRMLGADLVLPEACCPPVVSFDGTYANISALVMSKTMQQEDSVVSCEAPHIYFALLEEGQSQPTTLQVMECCDGSGGPAIQCGSKVAVRTYKAASWLQTANYSSGVYESMLHGDLQLYESYVPFLVEWTDLALHIKPGSIARMLLMAYNPSCSSLSPTFVSTQPLVSKQCAANCLECKISGPGGCDKCVPGSTSVAWEGRPPHEVCTLCAPYCAECYFHDQCTKCLPGYWPKYEKENTVQCKPCGSNCKQCTEKVCEECESNFGLTEGGTCEPCIEYCHCAKAATCDDCVVGYGLSSNGGCIACLQNCIDCNVADTCMVNHCIAGTTEVNGECHKCGKFCNKCEGSDNHKNAGYCDPDGCEKRAGYNPYNFQCQRCTNAECLACSFEGEEHCTMCQHGFGLTPDGLCHECPVGCKVCEHSTYCERCLPTYARTQGGLCKHCADQCANCTIAGPGLCDVCVDRYEVQKPGVCVFGTSKISVTVDEPVPEPE